MHNIHRLQLLTRECSQFFWDFNRSKLNIFGIWAHLVNQNKHIENTNFDALFVLFSDIL